MQRLARRGRAALPANCAGRPPPASRLSLLLRASRFIGTVDYIWFTPDSGNSSSTATSKAPSGGWRVQPLAVLMPPPLQGLRTGLPSHAWPSDHVSLVADFMVVPR